MTKKNDLANIIYDTLFENTKHKQFKEIMNEMIDHMIDNSNDTISFNWNGKLYTMKIEEEGMENKGTEVNDIKMRLDYLREQIRNENISYGEIAELQGLAEYIDKDDVELLEWAGVKEDLVAVNHMDKDADEKLKNMEF